MEEERLFDETVAIRDSSRPLKKYGSTCNHLKRHEEYVKHVISKEDTLQGISLKYGVTMEKIRRANRMFASDSLHLREHLLIPITKDSPYYEFRERKPELSLPNHRASIAGMPSDSFSPGSPDEKKSFDDFLNRMDSSLAVIKKHVEKSKEKSEFVRDLDVFVRHRPTARLRQSASLGAAPGPSRGPNDIPLVPIPPPPPNLQPQGRRDRTSPLQRVEHFQEDLLQL